MKLYFFMSMIILTSMTILMSLNHYHLHDSVLTLAVNTASVSPAIPSKVNKSVSTPASSPRVLNSQSRAAASSAKSSSGHSVVQPSSRAARASVNAARVGLESPARSVNSHGGDAPVLDHRAHVVLALGGSQAAAAGDGAALLAGGVLAGALLAGVAVVGPGLDTFSVVEDVVQGVGLEAAVAAVVVVRLDVGVAGGAVQQHLVRSLHPA